MNDNILSNLKAVKEQFLRETGSPLRELFATGPQIIEAWKRGFLRYGDSTINVILSPAGRAQVDKFLKEDVKQAADLLAAGGKFYTMGEEAWCDTPTDSWKLVPGLGYVHWNHA